MIENPNVICNECGFCKQNKILEQQLKIAVDALEQYASEDNWVDCHAGFLDNSIDYGCYGYYGFQEAQEALQQIKELKQDD